VEQPRPRLLTSLPDNPQELRSLVGGQPVTHPRVRAVAGNEVYLTRLRHFKSIMQVWQKLGEDGDNALCFPVDVFRFRATDCEASRVPVNVSPRKPQVFAWATEPGKTGQGDDETPLRRRTGIQDRLDGFDWDVLLSLWVTPWRS
jgi:hypothetical protein